MSTEPDGVTGLPRAEWVKATTRLDQIIYPLFTWGLLASVLGTLGLTGLALLRRGQLSSGLGWWLLIAPVAVDLCSAYLTAARLVRGGGLHGEAGISWIYYAVFSLCGLAARWWWRLAVLAGLTLFHACCQYYVPFTVARWLGWRNTDDGAAGASLAPGG